jgi:hypothetical protein
VRLAASLRLSSRERTDRRRERVHVGIALGVRWTVERAELLRVRSRLVVELPLELVDPALVRRPLLLDVLQDTHEHLRLVHPPGEVVRVGLRLTLPNLTREVG